MTLGLLRHRHGKAEKAPRKGLLSDGFTRVEKARHKREARRKRRRIEKLDPENAPTRLRDLTRGWAD